MKTLIFALLLLPALAFGQTSNFHLSEGVMQYRNIFTYDSLNVDNLESRLKASLPVVYGLSNIQFESGLIRGDIKALTANYKQYGATWAGSWLMLGYPMDGKFLIEIKDGKYRLTVTDLSLKGPQYPVNLANSVTKRNATEFTSNRVLLEALEYINKDFTDRFAIPKTQAKSDW